MTEYKALVVAHGSLVVDAVDEEDARQYFENELDTGELGPARVRAIEKVEDLENPAPEDLLSLEELSEELAEATDSTKEEIEEGAENIAIEPPWEADVEDSGPDGP